MKNELEMEFCEVWKIAGRAWGKEGVPFRRGNVYVMQEELIAAAALSFRRRALICLPAACVSLGHDCCETVKVLLCASKEGLPVFVVAEEDFQFIQDEAYDAAQFLATSAGNQQALNFTRFLDRSGPPSSDVNSLDEKVALAFRHLKLPAEWNVLGTDATSHGKDLG